MTRQRFFRMTCRALAAALGVAFGFLTLATGPGYVECSLIGTAAAEGRRSTLPAGTLEALQGSTIKVTLRSGAPQTGKLLTFDNNTVTLAGGDGQNLMLLRSEVTNVDLYEGGTAVLGESNGARPALSTTAAQEPGADGVLSLRSGNAQEGPPCGKEADCLGQATCQAGRCSATQATDADAIKRKSGQRLLLTGGGVAAGGIILIILGRVAYSGASRNLVCDTGNTCYSDTPPDEMLPGIGLMTLGTAGLVTGGILSMVGGYRVVSHKGNVEAGTPSVDIRLGSVHAKWRF